MPKKNIREGFGEAAEDYLKAIFTVTEREGEAKTKVIAEHLQVQPASVTSMLKKLETLGLVSYQPYYGAVLTSAGEKVAVEIIRHHRLLESFLAEALGMSWADVHDEAERLEHVISEEFEARIADYLGHPERDPHGDPIPDINGAFNDDDGQPLAQLDVGQRATIARVKRQEPDALSYFSDIGLVPGASVALIRREPMNGPLTLDIAGTICVLGSELAADVVISGRSK